MKRLRYIAVFISVILAAFSVNAADTAQSIMNQCASRFSNAPSVTVDFAIMHDSGSMTGSIVICKKLFRLTTPEISIWFDNKTQWTYMPSSNEVNITEPTGEELMESNPFEIISSASLNFNCRMLKSSPGNDIIELTPKNNGLSIRSAKITISKSTGWPTSLIMTSDNGGVTSISITKVSTGKSLPQSSFRYDPKSHAGVRLVDLR